MLDVKKVVYTYQNESFYFNLSIEQGTILALMGLVGRENPRYWL